MDNHGPGPSPTDIRTAQVFHGYPGFPPSSAMAGEARGPSIPPLMRDSGIGSLGRHPAVATSSKAGEMMNIDEERDDDERNPTEDALFGTLPDGKRRKFILVEDPQRGGRVRVKVMLDQVDMNEIPDSYRMSNSVYPRSYFPVQMKNPRGRVVPGKRYLKDDTMTDDDETATVGRIMAPAPQLDGEGEIAVPRLTRRRHRQDVMLNDLGYRMSWSQSRVFAGRPLFLQRSRKCFPYPFYFLYLIVWLAYPFLYIHSCFDIIFSVSCPFLPFVPISVSNYMSAWPPCMHAGRRLHPRNRPSLPDTRPGAP